LALHQFLRFPKLSSRGWVVIAWRDVVNARHDARTWLANVATGLVSTVIRLRESEIIPKRRAPILALFRAGATQFTRPESGTSRTPSLKVK
jgi:hypothetical protein